MEEKQHNWRNNASDEERGRRVRATSDSISGSFAWKTYCARSNSIKKSSLLSLYLARSFYPLSPLFLLSLPLGTEFSLDLSESVCVCVFSGTLFWVANI